MQLMILQISFSQVLDEEFSLYPELQLVHVLETAQVLQLLSEHGELHFLPSALSV